MSPIPLDCRVPGTDGDVRNLESWCDTYLVRGKLRCIDDPEGSSVPVPEKTQGSLFDRVARMADRIRSAQMAISVERQGAGEDIRRGFVLRMHVPYCTTIIRNRHGLRTHHNRNRQV